MQFKILWYKIPLKCTYHLSFGAISEFNSVLAIIEDDQELLWGEVTALPGYSWETAKDIYDFVKKKAKTFINSNYFEERSSNKYSFAMSPILTVLNKYYIRKKGLKNIKRGEISLVGIVDGDNQETLKLSIQKAIKTGYSTFKVKLLGRLDEDIEKVKFIQKNIPMEISLRLDANQSYTYKMVEEFFKNINLENIKLLEQPFKVERWDLVEKITKWSPIPIMLDESIWDTEDLKKASEIGVRIVKLKLVKHGGLLNTIELIDKAKQLGLEIILGNGVQTDLGCIDEAWIYLLKNLKYDGEMNGWLRMPYNFVEQGIEFRNGKFLVDFEKAKLSIEKLKILEKFKIGECIEIVDLN